MQGRDRFAAAVEAARLRLRPILMTSLAFIFGVAPLVWAVGAGAELRQTLGTAVFSGMIGVTDLRPDLHAGVLRGRAAGWPIGRRSSCTARPRRTGREGACLNLALPKWDLRGIAQAGRDFNQKCRSASRSGIEVPGRCWC